MDGTTAYVLASAVANQAKSESDARYEELSQKIENITKVLLANGYNVIDADIEEVNHNERNSE